MRAYRLDAAGASPQNRVTVSKILAAAAALAVLVVGALLLLRARTRPEPSVSGEVCALAAYQREIAAKAPAPLPVEALRDFLTRQGIDAQSLAQVGPGPGQETALLIAPGEGAVELWRKLREAVPQTGRWPVILGPDQNLLENLRQNLQVVAPEGGPRAILEQAGGIDAGRWLEERGKADPDLYDFPRASWFQRAGLWAGTEPNREIHIHRDILSGAAHDRIGIALVPTPRSWEAPAFLPWGGWNDCPEPAAQVAVLQRWQSLYGAEVLGLGTDIAELQVACPVSGRDQALTLAREHFLYCYDIVHQGTGTVDHLAAGLVESPVWFFWWD